MAAKRPDKLDRPVDVARDHVLGNPGAEMTLVEYGSYTCPFCHAVHDVIADLRNRFGDRMRYVFRHLPIRGSADAVRAAELAEYAAETRGQFWEGHDALMKRGPAFGPKALEGIASEFDLPPRDHAHAAARHAAASRVQEGAQSALAEAMLGSLGHRLHTATLDFVRWGPSAGLLLLLMSVLVVVLTNSPVGPAFESWWSAPFGFQLGSGRFTLPVIDWVNHGLLTVFFLVVGLEIKREFTVGRLATRRAAALPAAASLGGIIAPALIYLRLIPPGPLAHGWGVTIATDTAFAVALIVLLGDRVPVDLRVFLTAAVIVDDLVAIAVVALFYSGAIDMGYLAASIAVVGLLVALSRWSIDNPLPYALLGVALWVCLHEARRGRPDAARAFTARAAGARYHS